MKFIKIRSIVSVIMLGVFIYQNNHCSAQTQRGQIVVNTGIGFSTIQEDVFHFGISGYYWENNELLRIYPIYNCSLDYGIGKIFSLGLAASKQNMLLENYSYQIPYTFLLKRTNFGIRFLAHLTNGKNENLDFYTGARIGESYWTDNGWAPYPSIQALFGIRFYFVKDLGIHGEFGLGTPYLIEGGLTFRVNTIKVKETK